MDVIVIGAGIAGAVAARCLAEEQGKQVLVLEKKEHVGGNCYDEKDAYGILIHKYGPHIFHTNDQQVYDWLSRFTEWYAFGHEVVARVGDRLLPVPFNLNTLKQVYGEEKGEELTEKLVNAYGMGSRVPILKLRQSQDPEIQAIMDEEMGNPEMSVDVLAGRMGLERSQFYRKIKSLTNYSPVELIRKIRLQKAHQLLVSTEKSVSEIAYEVGFSTPAYFTKCYREAYGRTPTAVRSAT